MSPSVSLQGQEPKSIGRPATIALDHLIPSKANRQNGKDGDLAGLASSIAAVGLLYPLIVQPMPDREDDFLIIAGERRFRALKRLKAESAPCVIVNGNGNGDNPDPEILRVVENHQRKNLEPLEEAAAIRALLDAGLEVETVARSLGRSRAWIARRSSLTDLSERWVREVKDPESKIASWPPSHLEIISRFPAEVQDRMLDRWGHSWRWSLQPTLQDLKEATGGFLRLLAAVPWKLDDETLCPETGACAACPKRSSHAPELFPDELPGNGKAAADDHCLDPSCWQRKAELFLKRRIEILRRDHANLILLNAGDYNNRASLADTFGGEVVNAWDVAMGKKSDTGAVPALVVGGGGLGKLKWVMPAHDGPTTPASRRRERSAYDNGHEGVPYERTPEEKKAPYDKRRRQIVIDMVKAKLETLAAADDRTKLAAIEGGERLSGRGLLARTLCLLSSLLTEYGWQDKVQGGPFCLPEQPAWTELAQFKNHELGTGELRKILLGLGWGLLRLALGRLAARLIVTPGEWDNDRQYADVETICTMLGFDLAALRDQAAEAIPYAKCWRDDVKDEWAAPAAAMESNSSPA